MSKMKNLENKALYQVDQTKAIKLILEKLFDLDKPHGLDLIEWLNSHGLTDISIIQEYRLIKKEERSEVSSIEKFGFGQFSLLCYLFFLFFLGK